MISTKKNWSKTAKEGIKFFEKGTRTQDGKEYWFLKNTRPTWLYDLCYEAHKVDDVLPNDYIYEYILDALYVIAENGGGAERLCEIEEDINEIEGEIYNGRLLAWVSSNLSFSSYVDEAMNEYGCKEHFNALIMGNTLHKQAIARSVLDSINDQADEVE